MTLPRRLRGPAPLFALLALVPLAGAQSLGGTTPLGSGGAGAGGQSWLRAELAGNPLPAYPWFEYVRAVHETSPAWVALDPTTQPWILGRTCDIWIVAAKSDGEWTLDASLVDVRGAQQTVTFGSTTLQGCTFLVDGGNLSGDAYDGLGVGYDVVLDFDRDGRLGPGDVLDGAGPAAGFYVVRETTLPGPHPVTEINYSGGSFLGQNTFYPTDVAQLGQLPVVVVSHGNGHNYNWYDHIGTHLASWGCIVMSHQNNTQPGVETASTTTLTNTDYFLGHLDTIANGELQGHVDPHRIVWIGHSRGGEGVVRAYHRVLTGAWVPVNFTIDDIRLVCSIAPTSFLAATSVGPHHVPYHLFVGASDSDVTGGADNLIAVSFPHFERSLGDKTSMSLQGAGHADFHNGGGFCYCTGPALIGDAATHSVELGYYLPLVKRYTEDNVPARDYLERMYDEFRPLGIPGNVIVAKEYLDADGSRVFPIEDFQTNPALTLSSSGTAVTWNVLDLVEDQMRDTDASFDYSVGFPMNGMTRWRDASDDPRCAVFDWDPSATWFYEIELPAGLRDVRKLEWLDFRACEGTRHPETDLFDAPASFVVELVDAHGVQSAIDFGTYGRLTRTYKRGGLGLGHGWANEFATVRLRLADFRTDGSGLDLADVRAVRFLFGPGSGADRGRIGIDDVRVVGKGL